VVKTPRIFNVQALARGFRLAVQLTLAITWPQSMLDDEDSHAVAAQVHGGVRRHSG
jgi:hypothetical protein